VPLHRRDLDLAVQDGIVSREQAERLWERAAGEEPSPRPAPLPPAGGWRRAPAAAVAGVVAASAAAAWVVLAAWEGGGAAGGFAAAAAAAFAAGAGARALERRSLDAAAGLLACVAVALVPVAVHGLHFWLGHPRGAAPAGTLAALVGGPYFPAAAAAVVAAAVGLRLFASPAVAAVLVAALWLAALLAAPLVFGPSPAWARRALVSAAAGLGAIGVGVILDGRTRRDLSSWLYVAGLSACSLGLVTIQSESGASRLFGAAVNVALVLVSVALRRPVFALFGAVGLAAVLGELAEAELDDRVVPYAIAAVAAAAAGAAVAWRRLSPAWEDEVAGRLPAPLLRLLPPRRRRT
jgi:hypothetical protein